MKKQLKILIVEDEMLIGAKISLQLSSLGYEITGIVARGDEALLHINNDVPDIILLDIHLKGPFDGIETAKRIKNDLDIPIIYLTANADDANFQKAKETKPEAFISKPYKKLELQRAVELVANRIDQSKDSNRQIHGVVNTTVLEDRIFIKKNDTLLKLLLSDILYIEAERNYCRIFTLSKEHVIVMTLKEMYQKLQPHHFARIHRSFVINLKHVNEVSNSHLIIQKKMLPISKSYKEEVLGKLQTL